MSGGVILVPPTIPTGNPLTVGEDPALLWAPGHGGLRCDLVDISVRVINPPRCPKKAIWRGLTQCKRGHDTTELDCHEHKILAEQGGAWWKCDACGQPMAKSTIWTKL